MKNNTLCKYGSFFLLCMSLTGCASQYNQYAEQEVYGIPVKHSGDSIHRGTSKMPNVDLPPKTHSYVIAGVRYYPLETARGYDQVGTASWYGSDFHGKLTASGLRYDMYALSAAHKHLPLGSVVRVINLENNYSVDLIVDDRGPFVDDRIIDLSFAAAKRLGLDKQGLGKVRVIALKDGATGAFLRPDMKGLAKIQTAGNSSQSEDERTALFGGDKVVNEPTPALFGGEKELVESTPALFGGEKETVAPTPALFGGNKKGNESRALFGEKEDFSKGLDADDDLAMMSEQQREALDEMIAHAGKNPLSLDPMEIEEKQKSGLNFDVSDEKIDKNGKKLVIQVGSYSNYEYALQAFKTLERLGYKKMKMLRSGEPEKFIYKVFTPYLVDRTEAIAVKKHLDSYYPSSFIAFIN